MRFSAMTRSEGAVVVGAVTAGAFLALHPSAHSNAWAARAAGRVAVVTRVETPLGLQGTRGAGGRVECIFDLVDPSRRKTDVQVQYAFDANGDGQITDD